MIGPSRRGFVVTTRNPIAGTTRSALLLIGGLLIGALFAAPPLSSALRDATGVATFREPFTSLAFADPDQAARGFAANTPVDVIVTNETGAPVSLLLLARGEGRWRAEQRLDLAAGEQVILSFLPPAKVGSISIEIEGRGVMIRAAVRR